METHTDRANRARLSNDPGDALPANRRHMRGTLATLLLAAMVFVACERQPPPEPSVADALIKSMHDPGSAVTRTNNMLELVQALPEGATREQLAARFDAIFGEMRRATRADLPDVREAFWRLKRQPEIVAVITERYNEIPADSLSLRTAMLAFLGELQRPDAFDFFRAVVWSELPPAPERPVHIFGRRDLWKILQAKAVQGIAFMRDAEGAVVEEHEGELTLVMRTHPSRYVRVTAINAYMWNRNDSPEAAAELYEALPEDHHQFVERPRFTRGTNRKSFNARLAAWRQEYAGNRRNGGR